MRDRLLLPCPEALDRFALHLDGELATSDGAPLEEHIQACAGCRGGARELAAIHRDLLRRAAGESIEASDPLPALLARARWDKAVSSRARRVARRESRPAWRPIAVAVAIAVGVLLALAGTRKTPASRPPAVETNVVQRRPEELSAPAPKPRVREDVVRRPVVKREQPAPPPPLPTPAPDLEPPPVVPPPAPAPIVRPTVEKLAAIARVEQVQGDVALESGRPAADGIAAGDTLHVGAGRAVVAYPDGTRLFLAGEASVGIATVNRVNVARGVVAADVKPRAAGEPLVFVTAQAEVTVLGTWLAVTARPDATLVSVDHGHVRATRRSDRWSIPIREGHYALLGSGSLPAAKPIPPNLLADPGFERGGLAWGGVWNRVMGQTFGGVEVTGDVFRSGSRALRLTTDREAGRDREVFQDFRAAPGEAFELAGWLRSDGVGGDGVRLSLLWISVSGNFSEDLTTTLRSLGAVLREDVAGRLAGVNGWTRLSTRATAPPRTRQVRVLLYVDADPSGPANAGFDDAVFRRLPRAGG